MNLQFYHELLNSRDLFSNSQWQGQLQKTLENIFRHPSHGKFSEWESSFNQIPSACTNHLSLNASIIEIGSKHDINKQQHDEAIQALHALHPWREGPFKLFDTTIDSEWRCDKKWHRIKSCLPTLQDKSILDVGCGNGYYMLRMIGAGAKTVIGVDPTLLFLVQYYSLIQCLTFSLPAYLLPIGFESLPKQMNEFDIIFSMGVLYHRRDPQEHLQRLFEFTKPGGMIVLETLIIDAPDTTELIPEERYAGMKNVWSIPSPSLVIEWLHLSNFQNVQLQNIEVTSLDEQRATAWSSNYSLENFLDPTNHRNTIEGYPRPTRAIFTAERTI